MLEDGAPTPALSAADDFVLAAENVATASPLETEKWLAFFRRGIHWRACARWRPKHGGGNAEVGQHGDKRFVTSVIQLRRGFRADIAQRPGEAVGQLAVVQDRPAAAGPPHERAGAAGQRVARDRRLA